MLNDVLKNAIDYIVAVAALLLAAPLFAIIGLAIKLDSSGPVFYRRRVLGRGGRTFDAFKFRTMVAEADAILAQHPEWAMEQSRGHKIPDDPRLTRVGRRLRKYSLNELPQLFNVLLGQMSLVGPRMVTPAEVENYSHWRDVLIRVKPGLTGLWQIGGRSDLPLEERIRLDTEYVEHRNILMDIRILLKTIPAVLRGTGAY